jgi:hypothetical protein
LYNFCLFLSNISKAVVFRRPRGETGHEKNPVEKFFDKFLTKKQKSRLHAAFVPRPTPEDLLVLPLHRPQKMILFTCARRLAPPMLNHPDKEEITQWIHEK